MNPLEAVREAWEHPTGRLAIALIALVLLVVAPIAVASYRRGRPWSKVEKSRTPAR